MHLAKATWGYIAESEIRYPYINFAGGNQLHRNVSIFKTEFMQNGKSRSYFGYYLGPNSCKMIATKDLHIVMHSEDQPQTCRNLWNIGHP